MKAYKIKEVDAEAMSAFFEEEKDWLDALHDVDGIENKKINYFFDSARELNGKDTNHVKKKSFGFFSDIGGWIKENPGTSTLIGAAIGGLAYILYKHISDKSGSSDSVRKNARSKRKKRHLASLEGHEEESMSLEKEEPVKKGIKEKYIRREELGIGIAAALGGSIVGAALGHHSLLAAIPVGIVGLYSHNLKLSMASIGMALVGGSQKDPEENNSGIIGNSIHRIEHYLNSWKDKLFPFKKAETKTPPGAVRTLLGLMYPLYST